MANKVQSTYLGRVETMIASLDRELEGDPSQMTRIRKDKDALRAGVMEFLFLAQEYTRVGQELALEERKPGDQEEIQQARIEKETKLFAWKEYAMRGNRDGLEAYLETVDFPNKQQTQMRMMSTADVMENFFATWNKISKDNPFCARETYPMDKLALLLTQQCAEYGITYVNAIEYAKAHGYSTKGFQPDQEHLDFVQLAMEKAQETLDYIASQKVKTEFNKSVKAEVTQPLVDLDVREAAPLGKVEPRIVRVGVLAHDGSVFLAKVNGYARLGENPLKNLIIMKEDFDRIMEQGVPLVQGIILPEVPKQAKQEPSEEKEQKEQKPRTVKEKSEKNEDDPPKGTFTKIPRGVQKMILTRLNFNIDATDQEQKEVFRKMLLPNKEGIVMSTPELLKSYLHMCGEPPRQKEPDPEKKAKFNRIIKNVVEVEAELRVQQKGQQQKTETVSVKDIR